MNQDGAAPIGSAGSAGGEAGPPENDAAGAEGQGPFGGPIPIVGEAGELYTGEGGGDGTGGDERSPGEGSPGEGGTAEAGVTEGGEGGATEAGVALASCIGLPENCGPNADESCCTSLLVTGGTFYRDYDGTGLPSVAALATISDFKLDKYEVTVGRFRQFVSAWASGWRPAEGSGKHTHLNNGAGLNASEIGWSAAWESAPMSPTKPLFPSTVAAWNDTLACYGTTWTPAAGPNETLPVTCTAFEETYAFCIWDGGFLPSEAEWNYAASGGAEQRIYPWGSQTPTDALAVYAPCMVDPSCVSTVTQTRVGSDPAGNGKYGQADLAGNMMERVLDGRGPPVNPCVDCALLGYEFPYPPFFSAPVSPVPVRGGSYNYDASYLFSAAEWVGYPWGRDSYLGFRCARSP